MNTFNVIKKISWPMLFILIGIGVTILYIQLKNEKSKYNFASKLTPSWRELGQDPSTKEDTGRILMKQYLEEQGNIWPHYFRLRTGDNEEILRGFWINKKMLDAIKAIVDTIHLPTTGHTPIINGYNVFFGKWDENAKRYYSLVVRATKEKDTPSEKDGLGVGAYFDMVDPCPDNCGSDN